MISFVLLAAGCHLSQLDSGHSKDPGLVGLKSFETCAGLADFLKSKLKSPIPTGGPIAADATSGTDQGNGAAAPNPPITAEEGDIVKQEGGRLYVVTASTLIVYDVSTPTTPNKIGEVPLDLRPREMHLLGFKVAVIGDYHSTNGANRFISGTRVKILDLSNPESVLTLKQYDLEGSYSDSRKVGTSLYLVLQRWMAYNNLDDAVAKGDPCQAVYVPETIDSGGTYSFTSWQIVGIDLNTLPSGLTKVSVIGSYDSSIYATPSHFYLTNLFYEHDETGIYLFDLDPSRAGIKAEASGSVPGRIVNQFSMDESDGYSRIATTTNRNTFGWV